MKYLTARRFVMPDALTRRHTFGVRIHRSFHGAQAHQALLDNSYGFEHFQDAHDGLVKHVAVLAGHHVPVNHSVGGVGMVATHVDGHPRCPCGRPQCAVGDGLFTRQDADPLGAGAQQRIFDHGVAKHLDRILQAVEQLVDGRDVCVQDVAAHTTRLHHAVVISIAADQFEDIEHVLSEAPGPHPDGVEADKMPGQAQPQQMRMNALQFTHDGADEQRPLRHRDATGLFNGLHTGQRVRGRADAADALDQENGFFKIFRLRQFLNAAMVVTQLDVQVNHRLTFHVQLEKLRLFLQSMVGPNRHNSPLGHDAPSPPR